MSNIIETETSNGPIKTLINEIKTAGSTETPSRPVPLKVSASNDAAFARLPKADAGELIKNSPRMKRIQKYHILSGKVMAAEMAKIPTARNQERQSVENRPQQSVQNE